MLVCIPDVLDWTELKKIHALIGDGAFKDGRLTAGYRAKRVKHNLQLDKEAPGAQEAKTLIVNALKRNRMFQRAAMPHTIRPFLISRYEVGMQYGMHVDDALMGGHPKVRSDVSITVFLNAPDEYEGGELTIASPFGEQQVKLPAGAAVVYPSSTLHRVEPVTRGVRLAAVSWIQSYVRDPARREILFDIYRLREKIATLAPDAEETDLAFKTHSNLLRMWSE
ncbi:MAG: Fe2+-dependent dioxygenase [Alphaproteobacteria bacterium]|nr:MAG: Fe2+-dependent dioxygenase [Alphaproteobacteria bacterium]